MDNRGIRSALIAAALLGLAPVFGKAAILAGVDALAVVATRTAGAAALLFLVILAFRRQYFYIFSIGFIGCLVAGLLNGVGSLLYYSALDRIDASLGQLLFMTYPVFIASLLYLDGQRPTKLTIFRLIISIPAIFLLTFADATGVDKAGVILMLIAAFLYAIHIPINQRVLYEIPAPTVTLYTLLAMTAVVVPVYLFSPQSLLPIPPGSLESLVALTLVTFLSRLLLFAGVKSIGSLQTALFGLAELLVTVVFAHLLLGETLSFSQWLGALVLVSTLALGAVDRQPARQARTKGWLYWLRPPVSGGIPTKERQTEPESTRE